MLERHLNDKDVLDRAETLINMFPPESFCPILIFIELNQEQL